MKKVVLKLEVLDERIKQKAMKNVSSLPGVDSISMDMKDKKLTVTGEIDPVTVVSKLRKICHTEIVSVGPAKEPEKKKKEDDKKKDDDKKKEEDKKKIEAAKKKEEEALKLAYAAYYQQQQQQQLQQQYSYYNNNYNQQQQPQQGYYQYNHPPTPYYSKVVQDETPNCVIS